MEQKPKLTDLILKDLSEVKSSLSKISQREVHKEDYEISSLDLLDYKAELYEVRVDLKKSRVYQSPLDYWNNVIEPLVQNQTDLLQLWTNLNSLSRQLRDNNFANADITLSELVSLQIRLREIGAIHLSYDDCVETQASYKIKDYIFRVRDPQLAGKKTEAYSFTKRLEESIFFNPDFIVEFVNAKEKESSLKVRGKSSCLLEVRVS